MGFFDSLGKAFSNYEKEVSRKIDSMERSGKVSSEKASAARERLSRSSEAGEKLFSYASSAKDTVSSITSPSVDSIVDGKTLDEWDREWISIGKLKDANLTPYNKSVGLYKHVVAGKIKYIGRATEYNNGGLRKRLSDYRRESNSAREHTSGTIINEHIDEIETYVLVVGTDKEAVEITKKLEPMFIKKYSPEWNRNFK